VDVHASLLVEGLAPLTLSARLTALLRVEAVDGFGKDAGTSRLANTARTAKEIGMSQLARADGILQRCGQRPLTHHGIEVERTIF